MDTVYKYVLDVDDYKEVKMPAGAELLHIEAGDYVWQIFLWARVNTENEEETRAFRIAGTGHDLGKEDLKHVGTTSEHSLVWHVFEVK